MLYAYPFLKTVNEDYAQHIRNKALLSYDGRRNAEELLEYLAEEILQKRRLEFLKQAIEEMFDHLEPLERVLVEIRFFGKKQKVCASENKAFAEKFNLENWNDSKRNRSQQRLFLKVSAMLCRAGVTKQYFEEELLPIALIKRIYIRTLKRAERSK